MLEGKYIHIGVALLSLVACLLIIIPYWKNRKHYLISYNGYKITLMIGILSTFTMVANAVFYIFELPCIFSASVTALGASCSIALQVGRYIRYILMNRANVLRSELLTINKTVSSSQILESNNSTFKKETFEINNNNEVNFEKNIEKKYMKPIYIVFAFVASTSFILSLFINWDNLFKKCQFSSWKIFIPLLATLAILTLFLPHIFIYTIKNLSIDKKIDVLIFIFVSAIGGSCFGLAKAGLIKTENSNYFFYACYYSNVLCSVGIPLYNIYITKHKNKNTKKVTKDAFINLLFDKNFIILLKKQSIQMFCVENVLFWETHQMLMTVVFNNYLASNSEKRKNKLIQKKNLASKFGQSKASLKSISISRVDMAESQELSNTEDNKCSNEIHNESNSENIDIVVINKDDNRSFSGSSINKQDIFDNTIINFIDEKHITFKEDINENECNTNLKIDEVYDLLFRKYCQNNNVKLTNKELSINSFLVYDQSTQYFKKVYETFIDPDGVSPLNISNNVLEEVKRSLQNNTFSHKVFKQVLEEVIDMMYFNVYMNSIMKMNISK